jgi:hypothetical protein
MPDAPGRNDPCRCGSGQKYKKCCLPKDEAAAAVDRPKTSGRAAAMEALIRFAYSAQFEPDHGIANLLFWVDRLDGMDDAHARDLVEHEDTIAKYNGWFLFDLEIDEGQTVADMFLEQRGWTVGPDERDFIERIRVTSMRLYQIETVEPEKGVHLVDLWTKDRVFVHERLGTAQMVRWDLIGARVVSNEAGIPMFEGGLYLYPVAEKALLLKTFKSLHRPFHRQFPDESLDAFFKRHAMVFHHAWLDLVVLRPLPRMVTAEGDEMIFTRVVFDVRDEAVVRAALAKRDDVDVQDDGSFVWLEDADEMRRILGTLTIEGRRAAFEATSRERGARGRDWLESIAGAALTYRATSYETVAQALKARVDSAAPNQLPEIPPEIEAEILREMQDTHYRAWLDQPIPMLKNYTPRQAAVSKSLRPLLRDLLQQLDNQAERTREAGRFAYDSGWLWTELGLDRPPSPS